MQIGGHAGVYIYCSQCHSNELDWLTQPSSTKFMETLNIWAKLRLKSMVFCIFVKFGIAYFFLILHHDFDARG